MLSNERSEEQLKVDQLAYSQSGTKSFDSMPQNTIVRSEFGKPRGRHRSEVRFLHRLSEVEELSEDLNQELSRLSTLYDQEIEDRKMSISLRQTNTSCQKIDIDPPEPNESENLVYILNRLSEIRSEIIELGRTGEEENLLRSFDSLVAIVVTRVDELREAYEKISDEKTDIKGSSGEMVWEKSPQQSQHDHHVLVVHSTQRKLDELDENRSGIQFSIDEVPKEKYTKEDIDLKNDACKSNIKTSFPPVYQKEGVLGFDYSAERYQIAIFEESCNHQKYK